jgi:hypothetical protein
MFKMLSSQRTVKLSKQAKREYLRNMGNVKYATPEVKPYKLVDLSTLPTLNSERTKAKS